MTKLSSRLQSRLAKRRHSIALWEQERAGLKIGLQVLHAIKKAGLPGGWEAQQRGRSAMSNLKGNIKGLVEDQQLDKALLKMAYSYENTSFILGGNMGQDITLVLEPFSEDESTRL